MYCMKFLFVLLICVKQETELAITARKFVYQKDMSEYCRRRVMPSVFLGRQVVDAYSQILHFSRLELPYSCFVSIRTESGSNIILVIQLMSDKSLIESCRESKNQLLVYEIGETFGGYWGPLTDDVMKNDPQKDTHMYTLKTTEPVTTSTTVRTTTRSTTTSTVTEPEEALRTPFSEKRDYIRVEVPIVNVSAKLVPGRLPTDTIFDPEDVFDTAYDVTPWAGMSYRTKILPLVQFSIENEVEARRTGEVEVSPRYQVDFNADLFTPDSRLILPLLDSNNKGKPHTNYNYNINRLLNFKKNKHLFAEKEVSYNKKPPSSNYQLPLFSVTPSNIYTKHYDFMKSITQKATEPGPNSWEVINDILKNLNKTTDVSTAKIDEHLANLLHGLSKMDANSVLLDTNSSWYTHRVSTSRSSTRSTKYRTDQITWRQPSASYRSNYLEEVDDTSKIMGLTRGTNTSSDTLKAMNNNDSVINNDREGDALLPLAIDIDGVILNATNQRNMKNITSNPSMLASEVSGTTVTTVTPIIIKPLTLVDHESWENMVHAASLMAVVLNQSASTPSVEDKQQGVNVTKPIKLVRRKKRYIHAIPIEDARPHHLPMKLEVPSSTVHADKVADAQEFQRLIELSDDEIHDRVALRYLRQYVGPALFNICDFEEPAARHVYLFNSSRLVLAISNFTLDRMTVVMTPARTLLTSDARCASAHLECQVSGARVCIDSLSACDGVPNCGSYDIYDEDRLMCGGSAGLQHNVCLAAITFLAVLLTILYTVHYWLKRCVPKVSDAFFIYTDAAENVLYLDTIMRSPYDNEDKDYYRNTAIQDYMVCTDMRINRNPVGAFFGRTLNFFGFNQKSKHTRGSRDDIIDDEYENMQPSVQRFYSFGEVELRKIGPSLAADVAVQTGSSLEINVKETIGIQERVADIESETFDIVAYYEGKRRSTGQKLNQDLETSSNQPLDELSILKFFRRTRSASMQMSSANEGVAYTVDIPSKHVPHTEEKEIQCHEYDHIDDHDRGVPKGNQITVTAQISNIKKGHTKKKLRFEEEAKTMQSGTEDDALEEEIINDHPRRSITFGNSKSVRLDETDSFVDIMDEPSASTTRELKSYFWGSGKSKGKKSTKKKMQVCLR